MGELLATIFIEGIINFLFSFPGAVIRWLLTGRKRSIKDYWNDDIFLNAFVGIAFFTLIILVVVISTS